VISLNKNKCSVLFCSDDNTNCSIIIKKLICICSFKCSGYHVKFVISGLPVRCEFETYYCDNAVS